jgi:hypothetical protein
VTQAAPASDAGSDTDLAADRAAVVAEIDARAGGVPPSLRPLTLNTRNPLYPPSAALAAKIDARVQAGYEAEGDKYPTSSDWTRVWWAIGIGALDIPVAAITGILVAFDVHWAWWFFIASLIVLVGATVAAVVLSQRPIHDPLRLTTDERRELNQARSWQSRQTWMGPRAATPEYRLYQVAHDTVRRLADSPAWGSRFLDEHRLRLNLAHELDGIDYQAAQLAVLRETRGNQTPDATHAEAWSTLLDRVARLRHYADGVHALEAHITRLEASTNTAQLDAHLDQLAVGSALDEFATAHVQLLSQDLARLSASSAATSFAPSPRNAT